MKWLPLQTFRARQVLGITLFWLLTNLFIETLNAINYDPAGQRYFFHFMFGGNAWKHLLITSTGPLLGGLCWGSFIVFYQREKLRGKTYARKLLVHSVLYLVFLSSCILFVGLIGALFTMGGSTYWNNFYNDIFSLRVLRLFISWYVVVIVTVFSLDVIEKYGPGTLWRVLQGKYHSPGREERIFMFLDLRSSTSIAEQIGDEKYFRMLHFFFKVANEAILNCCGEIYQYVGDEIVISWKKETGIRDANCLRCFSAVEKAVQGHAAYFNRAFGVVPSFKAGVHAGWVVTGEIGQVKKDIVYSGDVLNTTARIVALCNSFGEDLLISDTIHAQLSEHPGFLFTDRGQPELKGKKAPIGLYGVSTSG